VLTNAATVQISWPLSGDTYVLESTAMLAPANWLAITNVSVTVSNQNIVQIPCSSGSQFFRLRRL